MRKLILSALLGLAVIFGGVSNSYAFFYDQPVQPGIVKRQVGTKEDQAVRVYKLVRNPSRDTANSGWISITGIQSGDAVSYSVISDDGITVNTVDVSTDGAFAGIAVGLIPSAESASTSATDDVGKRNWGYIQVHGPCLAKVSAGGTNAHVAGDAFILSRDFGAVTSLEALRGTLQTASLDTVKAIGRKGGFFLDSAGSTPTLTQEEVFVQAE